jgi:catechol 2,3-dioxygenase-like lactoylglutathione lyase family enzyme
MILCCRDHSHRKRWEQTTLNLNQVTLAALNLAESIKFYQRLGFVQIVNSPHYARFALPQGSSTLSIHQSSTPVTADTTIYFECEQLDQVVAELESKGIIFEQQPRDESWLWREARLRDPSGNRLCLYWAGENRLNPPWRIRNTPQ